MPYPLNELFRTVQGEGVHSGTPSVFVRLQGCPVGCPWCDTKHTWPLHKDRETTFDAIQKKLGPDARYALVDARQITDAVLAAKPLRHVVLTGGEPCQYDLVPLCEDLQHRAGALVQIETSGTFAVRATAQAWVTVSPKVNMPGGYAVLPEALWRADEVKMPIGKPRDLETLEALLRHCKPGVRIGVQPLSLSPAATRLCWSTAIERGYRVSLQVHRLVGWS